MDDKTELRSIRKDIFLAAYAAGIGHIASSMSIVELLYVLYRKGILRYDAADPAWPERDRLVLSKGHGSLALYSVLSSVGFFDKGELRKFGSPRAIIGGEPIRGKTPGVEASTGSLGHGLSLGMGMAMALKTGNSGARLFVILGDGECQEGSVWEAAMMAPRFGLDNLVAIVDDNKIQKLGRTEAISGVSNLAERFAAFNWDVAELDGHDVAALEGCFKGLRPQGRPTAIIANTVKGYGLSCMQDKTDWHYRVPVGKNLALTMQELGITEEELDKCRERL